MGAANTTEAPALLPQDPHHFRVMVLKKPFGMNVQTHVLPRVVEVLPGFPAEAVGVRVGFVLTEVNEQAVTGKNFTNAFERCPLPCSLTFDTDVPVHEGNPFIQPDRSASNHSDIEKLFSNVHF